jgi:hypothetical protein
MTDNQRQAYAESFNRLVCAMRTRHPRLSRGAAARVAALDSPELYQRYLQATRAARRGIEQ